MSNNARDEDRELESEECMGPGLSLIMRCNTMPVQQAEAMEQLLRQVGVTVDQTHTMCRRQRCTG